MREIVVGELLDTEFGHADGLRRSHAFLGAHIDQMNWRFAAPGMVLCEHIAECASGASGCDTGFRCLPRVHIAVIVRSHTCSCQLCCLVLVLRVYSWNAVIDDASGVSGYKPVTYSNAIMNGAVSRMESTRSITPP